MSVASGQLEQIDISLIRHNTNNLRTVKTDNKSYLELVTAIKTHGFQGSIEVLEDKDENGVVFYQIVDGHHRYEAAKQLGMEQIPCSVIRGISETAILTRQITANSVRVATAPVEYAKHLTKIALLNPTWTRKQLADQAGISEAWLDKNFSLLDLTEPIAKMVDAGTIVVGNAHALARLPEDEQTHWVDRAISMSVSQFVPQVEERLREIRKARRTGGVAERKFVPVGHLRKKTEIEEAASNSSLMSQIRVNNIETLEEAVRYALNWALSLDPASVQAQRIKWEAEEKKREEKKSEKAEENNKNFEELAKKHGYTLDSNGNYVKA